MDEHVRAGRGGAALEAAADPGVASLALLSPSLDYRGVRIEAAMRKLGARPVLMVVSDDEKRVKHESIRYIFGNAQAFARILRAAEQAERAANGGNVVARIAALESR